MSIKIQDTPKINLSLQRHIFSKVFDFTKDSKDIIKRQNSKEISSLVMDLKGTRQISDIHTAKKLLDEGVNKDKLAKNLYDIKATGADIARLSADAHNIAYQLLRIFEKMSNGTFKKYDIDNLKITKANFELAIKNFVSERKTKECKKIGFN